MPRRKLPKSQLKVFRSVGLLKSDYLRILEEDKVSGEGIAVIVTKALNGYFLEKYSTKVSSGRKK